MSIDGTSTSRIVSPGRETIPILECSPRFACHVALAGLTYMCGRDGLSDMFTMVLSVLPFCVCQEVIDAVQDIQSLGDTPKSRIRGSRVFLGKGFELFVLLGI